MNQKFNRIKYSSSVIFISKLMALRNFYSVKSNVTCYSTATGAHLHAPTSSHSIQPYTQTHTDSVHVGRRLQPKINYLRKTRCFNTTATLPELVLSASLVNSSGPLDEALVSNQSSIIRSLDSVPKGVLYFKG